MGVIIIKLYAYVLVVIRFNHVSYYLAPHLSLSFAPNWQSLAVIGYARRHTDCQMRRRDCQGNSKRSLLEGGRGTVVAILFHMTLADPSQAQAVLNVCCTSRDTARPLRRERFLNVHIPKYYQIGRTGASERNDAMRSSKGALKRAVPVYSTITRQRSSQLLLSLMLTIWVV